jgi:hypothetical protein
MTGASRTEVLWTNYQPANDALPLTYRHHNEEPTP